MTLFSSLRKFVGLALAMLLVATYIQPAHIQVSYGEVHDDRLVRISSSTDAHGLLDAALYLSEDSEQQTGRKGSSHRIAADESVVIPVPTSPLANTLSIHRYVPPYRAAHAIGGLFLSPLKTGPPSI